MAYPWDFSTPIWYEWPDRYPLFYGPGPTPLAGASGYLYDEYYLYSQKAWEMAPAGVSFYNLQHASLQNAPIVITASGTETTGPGDAWAQVSGYGKYTKVGYGYFTLTPSGLYDQTAKEFSLSPDSSGKLVFNGLLTENVYIEYEAGPSGYYILDSVDYNPVMNEAQGGFIHFSQTTEPAYIAAFASQNSMKADGYQGCMITATLYDKDYDRVPNKSVVFEIEELLTATSGPGHYSKYGKLEPNDGVVVDIDASGYAVTVVEVTSPHGEAHVNYVTHNKQLGVAQVKAYYQSASGIYDEVAFSQFYLGSEPFVLDQSLLDTADYLT